MKTIKFVTVHQALMLHEKIVVTENGISGVRDTNLLESALAQPQMMLFGEYVYKDVFEMGSAYFFHIVKNHPFFDGNKRAGLLIALTFFRKNGMRIRADHDELYLLAIHTASSQIGKEEIAHFFKKTATFAKKPKK